MVVRELNVFEALMCFVTIATKNNEPLASVNRDTDDDRYDIGGCGAAGARRLYHRIYIGYSVLKLYDFCHSSSFITMSH